MVYYVAVRQIEFWSQINGGGKSHKTASVDTVLKLTEFGKDGKKDVAHAAGYGWFCVHDPRDPHNPKTYAKPCVKLEGDDDASEASDIASDDNDSECGTDGDFSDSGSDAAAQSSSPGVDKAQHQRCDGVKTTQLRREMTTAQKSFTGKRIKNGEWITVLHTSGAFAFVRTSNGNEGFVQSKYLPKLPVSVAHTPPVANAPHGEVTILHCSDTHCLMGSDHVKELPGASIFVITGDFTDNGKKAGEWNGFNEMLKTARDSGKYKAIVLIMGNHEVFHLGGKKHKAYSPDDIRKTLLTTKARMKVQSTKTCEVHFLLHEEVQVCGLRIHGCSWWPGRRYSGPLYGKGGECFNTIKAGIDVLLTHGPPSPYDGKHWAVPDLRDTVKRLQPGLHLYGHIHGGNNKGVAKYLNKTLTINSAMCTGHKKLCRSAHLVAGKPGGRFRIIKKVKVSSNTKKFNK